VAPQLHEQRRLAQQSNDDYQRARAQLSDLKVWALAAPGLSHPTSALEAAALGLPSMSALLDRIDVGGGDSVGGSPAGSPQQGYV
jgi:hypothetical protein